MITAIIVTRNAEKYIIPCINSIVKQFTNGVSWELIIVDGFSTDCTKDVAENYLKQSNIDYRILDNPQKTLASGWNLAIRNSKGKYVVRPDAHAEFMDDYIMNGIAHLENNHELAGVGGTLITYSDSFIGKMIAIVLSNPVGVGRSLFRTGVKRDTLTETAVYAVYHRTIFNDVGYFNEKLNRNQDIEFHQKVMDAGYKFLTAANMTAIYHSRATIKTFLKQGYQNGYWIMRSKAYHINHLMPFLFVLIVLISAVLYWPLLCVILGGHLIAGCFSYIWYSKIYNPVKLIILEFITLSLHVVYGIGSFVGVISRPGSEKVITF